MAPRHHGPRLRGVLVPPAELRRGPARQLDAAVGHGRRRAALDARHAVPARLLDADGEVERWVQRGPPEVAVRVEPADADDGDAELRGLAVVDGPLVGIVEQRRHEHQRREGAEDPRKDIPAEPLHHLAAVFAAAAAVVRINEPLAQVLPRAPHVDDFVGFSPYDLSNSRRKAL